MQPPKKLIREEKKGVALFIEECDKNSGKAFYKTSSAFLKTLLAEMALLAMKYTDHVSGDAPYIYHERQLNGLIVPALSKICDGAVLMECPIRRSCTLKGYEKDEQVGWVDYWCSYCEPHRKNLFLLEVKHSHDNYTTNKTCRDLVEKWREMCISQLQSVRKEAKEYVEEAKGVIRIGLLFVTSSMAYGEGNNPKTIISEYKKARKAILERLKKDVITCKPLTTTPNFIACWSPPQKHIEKVVVGRKEIYPGIIMMGKIFEPIAHKGCHKQNNRC